MRTRMAEACAFQWDYGPAGNRTYKQRGDVETYYTYNEANELLHTRQLPADEWTYFQYDPRGNTIAMQEPDGTTYFAYNALNLVTAIAYKAGVANYFYYDSQMRRYAIRESTGLSYFTWDTNGMNLLCERDAGGATVAEYTHGETPINGIGTMTAAKKADGGGTEYQYPVYDHRGTVMRLTDGEGTVSATYEYDAWGNALQAEEPPARNRFRYQTNWICLPDIGRGMLLSLARAYCAPLGRFLSRDRLAVVPAASPFDYVTSNPVALTDSRGLVFDGDTNGPVERPGEVHPALAGDTKLTLQDVPNFIPVPCPGTVLCSKIYIAPPLHITVSSSTCGTNDIRTVTVHYAWKRYMGYEEDLGTFYDTVIVPHERKRIESFRRMHDEIQGIVAEASAHAATCDPCNAIRAYVYQVRRSLCIVESDIRTYEITKETTIPWERMREVDPELDKPIPGWMIQETGWRGINHFLEKAKAQAAFYQVLLRGLLCLLWACEQVTG